MKRYDYLTEAFGVAFTIVQTQQVFQLISLILTCISISFSLIFTIYNWYKKAISDRKITKEEIEEGVKIINEHIEKIDNKISKDDK